MAKSKTITGQKRLKRRAARSNSNDNDYYNTGGNGVHAGKSIKLLLIFPLLSLYNIMNGSKYMKTYSKTSINNVINFTSYTTAATAFYHPIAGNNINITNDNNNSISNKDNVTLRSSPLLRDPTPMNQDQPIPAAFVYTKELYNTQQNIFRNRTNSSTIVMSPEVYGQLTNRIFRIKQARKPLLIMINSHPCAGKSFFIRNNTKKFMGCNLEDYDWINQRKYPGATPDSSFLMRIQQDNVIKGIVTKNTALLGSAIATRKSAKQEKYDDVIYINVIPPLTVIERNVKGRLEEGVRRGRWSNLEEVIKRRQKSLLFAIKDEVLVEPLFATFQEGLEFCINTYNTYNNTDDMYIKMQD
jgi:hypothetical protein